MDVGIGQQLNKHLKQYLALFVKIFLRIFLVKINGEIKFTFIVSKSSLSLNFEKSVIFPKPAQLITKSTSQFSTIFSKLFISVKSYFIQIHLREENFLLTLFLINLIYQ